MYIYIAFDPLLPSLPAGTCVNSVVGVMANKPLVELQAPGVKVEALVPVMRSSKRVYPDGIDPPLNSKQVRRVGTTWDRPAQNFSWCGSS